LYVSSSRLNQFMDSFSSSGGLKNNPIINKIQADTVYNDKNLQMLLLERGLTSRSEITTFVDQEISRIHNFIKSNSGTTLQFIKDSSNGIYQIKSGNSVYNVDPSAGPLISNTLPVIFGNGGIDSNGNFYLDTRNSRLGKSIIINVYGGHYEGVKASREAQRNADSIRQGITNTIENKVKGLIKNPASKGYKVYSPY